MTEMIIAALLLFTNKAYIKPDDIRTPVIYAEKTR